MESVFATIVANIQQVFGWLVNNGLGKVITFCTTNTYFLFAITLCLTVTVIGIALKFLKSFGLKRGSKRRGR